MAGVSRLYHRLRRVLLSTEWASLPDRLLSDPIKLANAVAVLDHDELDVMLGLDPWPYGDKGHEPV